MNGTFISTLKESPTAVLVVVLSVLVELLVQTLHMTPHISIYHRGGIKCVRALGSVTFGMITECSALGAGFGGFRWSACGWYLYLGYPVVSI